MHGSQRFGSGKLHAPGIGVGAGQLNTSTQVPFCSTYVAPTLVPSGQTFAMSGTGRPAHCGAVGAPGVDAPELEPLTSGGETGMTPGAGALPLLDPLEATAVDPPEPEPLDPPEGALPEPPPPPAAPPDPVEEPVGGAMAPEQPRTANPLAERRTHSPNARADSMSVALSTTCANDKTT